MQLRLKAKIILIIVVILSFTIGANTLISSYMLYRNYSEALQSEAAAIGQSLKYQLDRLLDLEIPLSELVGFEEQCLKITQEYEKIAYAMVLDRQGKILFHSDNSKHGDLYSIPKGSKILNWTADTVKAHTERIGGYFETVLPILRTGGEIVGSIRLGFSVKTITRKTGNLIYLSAGVAIFFLILSIILLVYSLSSWVTNPLGRLLVLIKEVGKRGTDDVDMIEINTKDELGELAAAFNQMTFDLCKTTVSRDYVDSIIANMMDALIVLEPDLKIKMVNSAVRDILGYQDDELIGKHVDEILTETEKTIFKNKIKFKGEIDSITYESCLKTKSGETVPVLMSGSRIKGIDDAAINIVLTAKDITDRKQVEETLRRTASDAYAANQAKSDFLASMSHEIRAPMSGVIGIADLLLNSDLNCMQIDYIKTIIDSANSLMNIINDILDLSKIEAGRLDLEMIDFNLRVTLDEFNAAMIKPREKEFEYIFMIDPEVPALLIGDPGRLRQVLTNIVGNAFKFTQKGEVVLRISPQEADDETIALKFSVSDTGIGIPADRIDKLFEAFTQAETSTTRKYGGTGLGLSITKKLVDLMGGAIHVESEIGRGSTFWFTAVFKKQKAERLTREIPAIDIKDENILVVDDSETNRLMLKKYLHSWHCRCDEAPDASTALTKLKAAARKGDAFKAVLLDMHMPGMSGETLGVRIKEDESLKETLLILMTSIGSRGDVARLKEIGFSGYLNKPLRPSQIYDCLSAAIGGAKTDSNDIPMITRFSIAEEKKRNTRILVVEDNPTNQKVALAIIEKMGYKAECAEDGRKALRALRDEPYDLVLMDVQMPEMDGFETTHCIRDINSDVMKHDIPIIAMTAHAMQGDRERCLNEGMDDYVSKPLRFGALEGVIEKVLKNRSGEEDGTIAIPSIREKEIYDRNVLYQVLSGDEETIKSIMDNFIEETRIQIRKLKGALKNDDFVQIYQIAHSLKSASGIVGANFMKEAAIQLEEVGNTVSLEKVDHLINVFEESFRDLVTVISKGVVA